MPFRSMSTLESWLDEFRGLGYAIPGSIRVIQQDGAEGANTGLVAVTLANAPTEVYIQPETRDATRWAVTLEARAEAVTLTAPVLLGLTNELATISSLCAFLEAKSRAFVGPDTA